MKLRLTWVVGLLPILLSALTAGVPVWASPFEPILCSVLTVDSSQAPTNQESQRLGRKIDELVQSELTHHWYPHAVNRARGGFHQTMARDWSLSPDDDIFLVYQARMTWTAAAFAGYSALHRREFEGYARHGIAFLDRVMRDKELGGFHWVLGPDGRVDPARGRKARLRHGICNLCRQQGA